LEHLFLTSLAAKGLKMTSLEKENFELGFSPAQILGGIQISLKNSRRI
jgi:hypothetical protein